MTKSSIIPPCSFNSTERVEANGASDNNPEGVRYSKNESAEGPRILKQIRFYKIAGGLPGSERNGRTLSEPCVQHQTTQRDFVHGDGLQLP